MQRSVRGCQGSWRGGDCWLLPQPPDGVSLGRRAHSSPYEPGGRALQVVFMIFCLAAHCVLNQLVPGLLPVHIAYPPNYAPLHLLKLIFMEKKGKITASVDVWKITVRFEARFHRPISISPHTEGHQPQTQPQEVLRAATTPQVGEVYFVLCVFFFLSSYTQFFLQILCFTY